MIRSRFEVLRAEKAFREARKITLRVIATETGLSIGTVHRFSNNQLDKVYFGTILKICEYFNVKSLDEMFEYSNDEAAVTREEIEDGKAKRTK